MIRVCRGVLGLSGFHGKCRLNIKASALRYNSVDFSGFSCKSAVKGPRDVMEKKPSCWMNQ